MISINKRVAKILYAKGLRHHSCSYSAQLEWHNNHGSFFCNKCGFTKQITDDWEHSIADAMSLFNSIKEVPERYEISVLRMKNKTTVSISGSDVSFNEMFSNYGKGKKETEMISIAICNWFLEVSARI